MIIRYTSALAAALIALSTSVAAEKLYSTRPAMDVSRTGATLIGLTQVRADPGRAAFEWGLTKRYGNSSTELTQGAKGLLSLKIRGLACATTYHYRFTGSTGSTGEMSTGEDMQFTTLPCDGAPLAGFRGPFAPEHWTTRAKVAAGRVLTTNAPESITLVSFAREGAGGSLIRFPAAPANATIGFRYILSGTIDTCPGSFAVGRRPRLLTDSTGSSSFNVRKGQAFTFALKGRAMPGEYGCISDGEVSMIITDFVFTPKG